MEEGKKTIHLKNISLIRPNETRSERVPSIDFEAKRIDWGDESDIHKVSLNHTELGTLKGFIFKKSLDLHPEESLADTLAQWREIRKVKASLVKEKREGFNIPGTVRGIATRDNVLGLLVTDLSEGGKNYVFDLKTLFRNAHNITREDMQNIKIAVIRDMDIARENGIKLVSGATGLDAWFVVKPKAGGDCKVYITDIGKYSSETRDPHVYAGDRTNDPDELYKIGQRAIDILERDVYAEQAR
ncbi:MAG: hypothetical protein AAB790_02515 [Patescibacteria group bacterium]